MGRQAHELLHCLAATHAQRVTTRSLATVDPRPHSACHGQFRDSRGNNYIGRTVPRHSHAYPKCDEVTIDTVLPGSSPRCYTVQGSSATMLEPLNSLIERIVPDVDSLRSLPHGADHWNIDPYAAPPESTPRVTHSGQAHAWILNSAAYSRPGWWGAKPMNYRTAWPSRMPKT